MIKRETPLQNALVLHPRFGNARASDADLDLEEAIGLADALGVDTKASLSLIHISEPTRPY